MPEGRGVTRSGKFDVSMNSRHHRLIKEFCAIIENEHWSAAYVERKAGIASGSVTHWRRGMHPNIAAFAAVLDVLGRELVMRHMDGRRTEEAVPGVVHDSVGGVVGEGDAGTKGRGAEKEVEGCKDS